jgi:hypothetical protein
LPSRTSTVTFAFNKCKLGAPSKLKEKNLSEVKDPFTPAEPGKKGKRSLMLVGLILLSMAVHSDSDWGGALEEMKDCKECIFGNSGSSQVNCSKMAPTMIKESSRPTVVVIVIRLVLFPVEDGCDGVAVDVDVDGDVDGDENNFSFSSASSESVAVRNFPSPRLCSSLTTIPSGLRPKS